MDKFTRCDGSEWMSVAIPTANDFLKKYHNLIDSKVSSRFKRNKDRIPDTIQNVKVRLLQKDFIGRWFFKHLNNELVTRLQAERIINSDKIKFISSIKPVFGSRKEPDSLWRISDILKYAKFDLYRYFYSIQGHNIDSNQFLKLCGYKEGDYNALKSLYMQGRIKPSELTQHDCTENLVRSVPSNGKCSIEGCTKKHFSRGFCASHYNKFARSVCPICEKGRFVLKQKGLSLADDWSKSPYAKSLRWNDSQLSTLLRNWRKQNIVSNVPTEIIRKDGKSGSHVGIEAGLVAYSYIIINNEVNNEFTRMGRTLDSSNTIFNDGLSPENGDSVIWEINDDGTRDGITFKDFSSMDEFNRTEYRTDIIKMASKANLSNEEEKIISEIDLNDSNVKEYAESLGVSVSHIHHIRTTALCKMKNVDQSLFLFSKTMEHMCDEYGCTKDDILGDKKYGSCAVARMKFFYKLSEMGLSIDDLSSKTGFPRERVMILVSRGATI